MLFLFLTHISFGIYGNYKQNKHSSSNSTKKLKGLSLVKNYSYLPHYKEEYKDTIDKVLEKWNNETICCLKDDQICYMNRKSQTRSIRNSSEE